MALTFFCVLIGGWVLFMGFKFYRRMDWDEPAVPTPDFGAMRKREAELLHIQDVLREAADAGKLSRTFMDEYDRFCEKEVGELRKLTASSKS